MPAYGLQTLARFIVGGSNTLCAACVLGTTQHRKGVTWMPKEDVQHSMSASRPAVRTSSASEVANTGQSQDLLMQHTCSHEGASSLQD